MKKKMLALLMAAAMAAGAFTGCGQESVTKEKSSETVKSESIGQAAEETTEASNFNKEGYPIVNEEITLNILIRYRDEDTNMVNPEEMPAIQKLDELTGIKTEWEVVRASDWSTKLNLILASGEYPDVIIGTIDDEEYGVEQGILIPLDDLIQEYMPNYTERIAMEESDPTHNFPATDGKTYAIGYMSAQNINTQMHHFINQTWLDTLDLDMPTDVESLTDVLRAFKTGDPNGNGEADEIAMTTIVSTDGGQPKFMNYLPMFGIPYNDTMVYIDDNKQVQFAPTQDAFREWLEWGHTLYVEGLMDPDSLSQDYNTVVTKLADGNVGLFGEYRLTNMGFDDGATQDCVIYLPENAKYGKMIETATKRAFVTCDNENVEATMRWFDAILETEMMFSIAYGEQNDGTDTGNAGWYYDENDKINTFNWPTNDKWYSLDTSCVFFAPGKYYYGIYQMAPHRVEKAEYCETLSEHGLLQKYSNNYLDYCKFTSEQKNEIGMKLTDIKTAVNEYAVKFVQNGVTDEGWNEFVKIFENMDVDAYVQAYQDGIDAQDIE